MTHRKTKNAIFAMQKTTQLMIIIDLFKHQWQKTVRAPGYYRNLWVVILFAIMGLYIAGALALLGRTFPRIVADFAPQYTAVEAFSGLLLYMMLLALAMRYFMQSLGTINLLPYQTLPVKRNSIMNYILLKPMLGLENYVTLAFVIPFATGYVSREPDALCGIQFVMIVVFLIWFNALTTSYLKRRFSATLWSLLGIFLFFGAIAALEFFAIFSLFAISKTVFGFLFANPIGVAIVFLLPLGAYFLNKAFFRKHFYAESFDKNLAKKEEYSSQFSFMDRFGKIGELMRLHVIAFMRNKRLRSNLYVLPIFLLYGLMFYSNLDNQSPGMLMFIGIFITGIFMLILGQFAISLNSTHFDAIMSKKITAREYIQSYYYLMLFLCIASFIFTTPYFLYGQEIAIAQTVGFLYNVGVNMTMLLLFNTFNDSRLELNAGGAFSFQGVSMKSFYVMIPILIIPALILTITSAFGASNVGFWIIGSMGVLGIILTKPLLSLCEKQFLRKKYYLCEGFRKKGD